MAAGNVDRRLHWRQSAAVIDGWAVIPSLPNSPDRHASEGWGPQADSLCFNLILDSSLRWNDESEDWFRRKLKREVRRQANFSAALEHFLHTFNADEQVILPEL